MYASLLYWLALTLPGYVVVRRFCSEDLRGGLMSAVALSFLASLALLSPICILCYATGAPLWVFSATCVVAVALGAVELSRRRWWGSLGRMTIAAGGIGLLILVADLVVDARTGGFLGGDAKLHLSRIRVLLEHGFSNRDAYVAEPCFFPLYHTNIMHALYAACSQITHVDYFGVWFVGLVWTKVLVASAAYHLAWTIFNEAWPAWLAVLVCLGHRGATPYLLYPNQLAPYYLLPLLITFAVEVCCAPRRPFGGIKVGVCALILGQVHVLYAAFAIILAGPVLAGRGLLAAAKGEADRRRLLLAALALFAGLPFILVARQGTKAQPTDPSAHVAEAEAREALLQFGDGWSMRRPASLLTLPEGGPWSGPLLALGSAAAIYGSRRRQAFVLLAMMLVALAIGFFPPWCSGFLAVVQQAWAMLRLDFIYSVAFFVLVPSLALLAAQYIKGRFARAIISLFTLAIGMACAPGPEPWTWRRLLKDAAQPAEARQKALNLTRRLRELFVAHIPAGATVLAEGDVALDLVMAHDCHIISPSRGGDGIPDWVQRQADLGEMLADETPWPRRQALLHKYDVEYFVPARGPIDWTTGHVREYWRSELCMIIHLLMDEAKSR